MRLLILAFNLALTLQSSAFAKDSNKSLYAPNLLKGRFSGWGVDPSNTQSNIKLEKAWKIFNKKSNVVVAVIDTGIEFDHPFLNNNIFLTKERKATAQKYGLDFSQTVTGIRPSDSHGHGTHVAGIIRSVFPEVHILALKYYNPQASGAANLNSTIKALEYAVDQGVDIINYSGGGPQPSADELAVLKKAERKGILVIAAAGNKKANIDNKDNAFYPASYGLSNVITVTAYDKNNQLVASSNYGEKSVDIAAPGHRIKSSVPGNAVGYMTGTSQATAFVSGVAALIKAQHPHLGYQQIRNIILSSSDQIASLKGKVLGAGKLNAHKALLVSDQVAQGDELERNLANHN